MASKYYSAIFFATLLGSTLSVIPDGEIQIGPIFGQGSRFFGGGHKHFEAVFQKGGDLKPLLAKKAILGAGVLGAGALAAGGAVLLAKKFPHLTPGWGWKGLGSSQGYGYGHGQQQGYYNNYNTVPQQQSSYAGWGQASSGYYQNPTSSVNDHVTFPASSYPTPSTSYPSTSYGYPDSQNEWQGSDSYSGSFAGWSR